MKTIDRFIDWAMENEWNISLKADKATQINESIISRYKEIPVMYMEFLEKVAVCSSKNQQFWFLCESNFSPKDETEFRWNEFEIIELSACKGDAESENEVREFWDKHLPICMMVDRGYAFYAISLKEKAGRIVYGFEPMFMEVTVEFSSFDQFLESIMSNDADLF
jgi:hypothetical protein